MLSNIGASLFAFTVAVNCLETTSIPSLTDTVIRDSPLELSIGFKTIFLSILLISLTLSIEISDAENNNSLLDKTLTDKISSESLSNGIIVIDKFSSSSFTASGLIISERVGEKGRVLASDLDQLRANRGKNDLDRHRRKNIEWSVKDATQDNFPMADKILIDAPCTGTGVMGRKPDIRWRRKPEDISDMATLQMKLLKHMSQFLNDGGTLVYGTCSMEPEENWNVVEQFLKLNADFKLMTGPSQVMPDWINEMGCLSTFPHIHDVDGLFAARITRS